MPRIHRFLNLSEVRSEAKRALSSGLHVGIDLLTSEPLFGSSWDQEARDLGRILRSIGTKVVVRGPGRDLPLGATDPYVVEQVRACHHRAIAAALHYGAEVYIVNYGVSFQLARSERMARLEAAHSMVSDLARAARTRGMTLAVELDSLLDSDSMDLLVDVLRRERAGVLLAPSRMLCLGSDPRPMLQHLKEFVIGTDLSDRGRDDLEPRLPGRGVMRDNSLLTELTGFSSLRFHTTEIGGQCRAEDIVAAFNGLAREAVEARGGAYGPAAPSALR